MITVTPNNAGEILDYISSSCEGLLQETKKELSAKLYSRSIMPLAAIWCTDSPILEIDGLKKCRFAPGERCRVENSKLVSGTSNAIITNVLGDIHSTILFMTVQDDSGKYSVINLGNDIHCDSTNE